MQFNKVAIVGMGLLGGSLGRALREGRLASCVAGYARRPATIEESLQIGAADFASTDLAAVVQNAEIVLLCTPVGQMGALARLCLPHLSPGAVVSDVGSTKASVVHELEPLFESSPASFIGSHPMAGSEQTGVLASRADLYRHARCVITPTPRSSPEAVLKVHALWRAVGARTLELSPEQHDQWVARSSHLPQVLASVLAHHVLGPEQPAGLSDLCATGFRDTTRLASGSPEMWRDIALSNREALREALRAWSAELARFDAALAGENACAIGEFLQEARERRDAWLRGFCNPGPDLGSRP